jgi:hypothetical protein
MRLGITSATVAEVEQRFGTTADQPGAHSNRGVLYAADCDAVEDADWSYPSGIMSGGLRPGLTEGEVRWAALAGAASPGPMLAIDLASHPAENR